VLRNFGLLVGGETIEEAFWLARNVMTGIDTQVIINALCQSIKGQIAGQMPVLSVFSGPGRALDMLCVLCVCSITFSLTFLSIVSGEDFVRELFIADCLCLIHYLVAC